MPDEEVAARLKRTLGSVKGERCVLGIPVFDPKVRKWTPDEEKLLGAGPDEEVARRLKRTAISVKWRREKLGIPNPVLPCNYWTAEEEAVLGTAPDDVINEADTAEMADSLSRW